MRVNIDLASVEYSSYSQRIAARLIDMFIVSLLFVAFISLAGLEVNPDAGMSGDLGLGAWIWFLPVVYLAYEIPGTASRGQTLGKRMMGILIVRTDGQTGIGLDRALTRFLTMIGISLVPFLGFLGNAWFFFDPQRQNVPDKFAKTYVIRTPSGLFSRDQDQPEISE